MPRPGHVPARGFFIAILTGTGQGNRPFTIHGNAR